VDGFVIQKHPVGILTVAAQRLAMIRHDRITGVVVKSLRAQLAQQFPHG